ncbi:hypothetical protein [Methylobacterium iners]|uniref:Uncharacterized protein n=1 Tax=Methylobacterium iners TaxID=418707 RepID=A0ABQ4RTD3_9HYPH|nr:hypothetical protein [Methylobacterium iners]GJD93418.1 hypothetical protein OCOJLMKI_0612 [Methylobacterium iners]
MHNHIKSDRCAWPSVSKQPGYGTAHLHNRERQKAAPVGSRNQNTPARGDALGKVVPPSDFESFGSFSG